MVLSSAMTLAGLAYVAHKYPPPRTPNTSIDKFQEVLETIIANNMNEEAVSDMDMLIKVAIKAVFEHIGDKHGGYYDEKATKRLIDSRNPKGYSGVGMGIHLFKRGDEVIGIQINEIFDGSRVDDEGLKPGDIVTHVDGVKYETADEYASKIKGKKGTTVKLRIQRGHEELGEFVIERVRTKQQTVYAKELECFLILRITQFKNDTSGAVDIGVGNQVNQMCEDGFRGVVLDLRNNPGGLLTSAINISEKWTDRGTLIVRVQPREGSTEIFPGDPEEIKCKEGDGKGFCYYAKTPMLFQGEPLVILVNNRSASASEIVTGSLYENNRESTWVMGKKTVGKGSVQSFFVLSDKTRVKTTTAHYYPAGDVVIDGVGVEPELPMDAPEIEGDDAGTRAVNYHLIRARMDPTYDLELAEAIRFLKMLEEDGHSLNWEPVNQDDKYKCYLNRPCEKLPSSD
jgi:carboxyl-terminal processing protease